MRRRMAEHPSPQLWCILGDITQDERCYETAWSMSGSRLVRAQRSLGSLLLRRGEYARSIECFQRVVAINPVYAAVWFSLGCAAMHIGQWTLAATALQRAVTLNPDVRCAALSGAGVRCVRRA